MDQIRVSIAGLFSENGDTGADIQFEEWMRNLDVDALDVPEVTGNWRPHHIMGAIQVIVGDQHENMGRFGSLELSLPQFDDEKLAMKLWKHFKGPAPSLNRLVITTSGFNSKTTEEKLAGSFLCLTALKYLDVDAVRIFRSLNLEASSIETLVLREAVRFWVGYDLSQFTCLRNLELYDYFSSQAPNETVQVSLPLLRQLTLNGNVQHLNQVQFHTPILQDINILGQSASDLGDKHRFLPDVESLRVLWDGRTYFSERWSHPGLQKELKLITAHFVKAKQLTVSDFARTALIDTVRLLHESGGLSTALESIGFEDKHGVVETIEVRTLLLPNLS
jgi:hypothetical protein